MKSEVEKKDFLKAVVPSALLVKLVLRLEGMRKRLLIFTALQFLIATIGIFFISRESTKWMSGLLAVVGIGSVLGPLAIIRFEIFKLRVANRVGEGEINNFYPPAFAEWLAVLIKAPAMRDAFVGDLEEEFQRDLASFGLNRARRFYWARTLRSIVPLLWHAAKRLGIAAFAFAGLKKWIGL